MHKTIFKDKKSNDYDNNQTPQGTLVHLLIMVISGGAIIPPLYGWPVDANRHELISNGLNDADALAQSANSICQLQLLDIDTLIHRHPVICTEVA